MDADTCRDCNDQSDRRRKGLILPSVFPKVAIIPIQIWFFYLAEQEGVFGTKFLAFSKAVDPLSITADSILLPEEKDEKDNFCRS